MSISNSSQIPKLETYSKIIGNEYSDKSTNSIKEVSSKASEVMLGSSFEDINIERMRKIIHEEVSLAKKEKHDIQCSNCYCKPIYGIRYKCNICPGYNLCCSCEESSNHKHDMLKLKRSSKIQNKEKLLQKLLKLGFTNIEQINELIIKYNFNFEDIINDLLEID